MSQNSAILGLPYIQGAQAQKHVTHNEALRTLDAVVQLAVIDSSLSIAPGTPDEGDRYIVATGATGDWAGQDGSVALFETGTWQFIAPNTGWQAWDATRAMTLVFDGTAWVGSLATLEGIEEFGLGANASPTTPFVVRAPAALWDAVPSAEGGNDSMIQSINRSDASADAGFALQTNYTTNGLFGFFGGDDLRISASVNGSTFRDGFAIEPATGIARQPNLPRFKGVTNFDNAIPQDTWTKIAINDLEANDQGTFDAGTNLFTAPADGTYLLGGTIVFKQTVSTAVRLQIRLVQNASVELNGSFAESTGAATSLSTSIACQTIVSLAAGDTVELQTFFRNNPGEAMANRTAFWGVMLP